MIARILKFFSWLFSLRLGTRRMSPNSKEDEHIAQIALNTPEGVPQPKEELPDFQLSIDVYLQGLDQEHRSEVAGLIGQCCGQSSLQEIGNTDIITFGNGDLCTVEYSNERKQKMQAQLGDYDTSVEIAQ